MFALETPPLGRVVVVVQEQSAYARPRVHRHPRRRRLQQAAPREPPPHLALQQHCRGTRRAQSEPRAARARAPLQPHRRRAFDRPLRARRAVGPLRARQAGEAEQQQQRRADKHANEDPAEDASCSTQDTINRIEPNSCDTQGTEGCSPAGKAAACTLPCIWHQQVFGIDRCHRLSGQFEEPLGGAGAIGLLEHPLTVAPARESLQSARRRAAE
eukprot:scaffold62285_cov56-Phaeocystis_antarctica.AAC.1